MMRIALIAVVERCDLLLLQDDEGLVHAGDERLSQHVGEDLALASGQGQEQLIHLPLVRERTVG